MLAFSVLVSASFMSGPYNAAEVCAQLGPVAAAGTGAVSEEVLGELPPAELVTPQHLHPRPRDLGPRLEADTGLHQEAAVSLGAEVGVGEAGVPHAGQLRVETLGPVLQRQPQHLEQAQRREHLVPGEPREAAGLRDVLGDDLLTPDVELDVVPLLPHLVLELQTDVHTKEGLFRCLA